MVPHRDGDHREHKSAVQALNLALRSGFSRMPVIGENVDDVLGVVYLKDLARRQQSGAADVEVGAVMRCASYVPESKHVDDLLRRCRPRARTWPSSSTSTAVPPG